MIGGWLVWGGRGGGLGYLINPWNWGRCGLPIYLLDWDPFCPATFEMRSKPDEGLLLRQGLLVNWWYIQLGLPPVHWAQRWSVKIHLVALMIQQRQRYSLAQYICETSSTVIKTSTSNSWVWILNSNLLVSSINWAKKESEGEFTRHLKLLPGYIDFDVWAIFWIDQHLEDDTPWPEPLSEGLEGGYMRP